MTAAPVLIGLLYDFPQHDGGDSFAKAVRLGLDSVLLDRPVEPDREAAASRPVSDRDPARPSRSPSDPARILDEIRGELVERGSQGLTWPAVGCLEDDQRGQPRGQDPIQSR